MAENSKAGTVVAVLGVLTALIGLEAAYLNGAKPSGTSPHEDPQPSWHEYKPTPTTSPSHPSVSSSDETSSSQTGKSDPPSTSLAPSDPNTCYLPGEWEFAFEDKPGSGQFQSASARFSNNSLILMIPPREVVSSCIIVRDSIIITTPEVNLYGDPNEQVILMLIPTRFMRQSENRYVATKMGIRYYLQKK